MEMVAHPGAAKMRSIPQSGECPAILTGLRRGIHGTASIQNRTYPGQKLYPLGYSTQGRFSHSRLQQCLSNLYCIHALCEQDLDVILTAVDLCGQ